MPTDQRILTVTKSDKNWEVMGDLANLDELTLEESQPSSSFRFCDAAKKI